MRKILAAAAALVALTACGDSTGPNAHVGVYTLQTINGQNPPVVVDQDATTTVEVTSGVVTLNENGTFSDRIDFRVTEGTSVVNDFDIATGTYTLSGNTVTFNVAGGGSYSMVLSGITLTQTDIGFTLVYRK